MQALSPTHKVGLFAFQGSCKLFVSLSNSSSFAPAEDKVTLFEVMHGSLWFESCKTCFANFNQPQDLQKT